MFGFRRKPKPPPPPVLSREASLSAAVVRSPSVRVEPRSDGGLALYVPFNSSAFVERLSRRLGGGTGEARVELDEMGAFVWEMCDARTTVREMIDRLAEHYRISRKDAEASLTDFLKSLTRRRLIALIIPKDETAPDAP